MARCAKLALHVAAAHILRLSEAEFPSTKHADISRSVFAASSSRPGGAEEELTAQLRLRAGCVAQVPQREEWPGHILYMVSIRERARRDWYAPCRGIGRRSSDRTNYTQISTLV